MYITYNRAKKIRENKIMKRFKKITTIIVFILIIKLSSIFIINTIIKKNYQNNIYNDTLIKTLYPLNIYEPYIVFYNDGNLSFQKKNYEEAIKKYTQALEKKPPEKKVCDIRVNLSLALLKTINPENKAEILKKAKENLYKNFCASSTDDSGKSKKAEQLEEEIKELENTNFKEETNNKNKEENKEKNEIEKNIEEKLRESKKNASKNREENTKYYESLENYEYYSGKKW